MEQRRWKQFRKGRGVVSLLTIDVQLTERGGITGTVHQLVVGVDTLHVGHDTCKYDE